MASGISRGTVVMSWLKALAAVSVLAAQTVLTTSLMPAFAADMPKDYRREPLPLPDRPLPRTYDINSGWYLRGDLGYGWGKINGTQSATGFPNTSSNGLGNAPTGGIGFGIKRGWIRTDVTADYLSDMKYRGTIAAPDDVTAKMSAWSMLLNGYLDLGSWYRVSPYLGGGIGAARVKTSDYQSTAAPPFTGGLSSAQWNFAWAAMAGVGFAVTPNIVADVGYRYLNLGDTKSATDASGAMTFKNIAAHEVRVGLRWSFDDLPVPR
jgi:opacity protein-like surface antigen